MKVNIWKNIPSRKGVRLAVSLAPESLTRRWNDIPNMGNVKTSAGSEVSSLRALRTLRLSLEAGSHPFSIFQRRGYQIIQATVEI